MAKSVAEILDLTGGRLVGDGSLPVRDAAPLESATEGEITFIAGRPRLNDIEASAASVIIARDTEELRSASVKQKALILVDNPQLAFARVLELLRPAPAPYPGVHPRAEIGRGVTLGRGVSIGLLSVVEEGAEIGAGAVLHASVVVGRGARIGEGSVIHAGAVVREGCVLGKRVVVHCNAVIGSDGFGYARDGARYYKIPQTGIVRVGDDVEIGACVAIDRATLGETTIGRGTKIDNLVQVAHNVTIGEDVVIAAQTGIAGSTSIGRGCQFGGQVGVGGHIKIGDGVQIGAKSGISHDLPGGAPFSGIPAMPHGRWLRAQAMYARLPELRKRIDELERRLRELEEGESGQ
jgi:UDP-3-O-[3-hydroxymyristoyl] glucosamine N-acyltransferase